GEPPTMKGDADVVAPSAVVPASCVQAVHLRTDGDVGELQARRYDNFEPDRYRLTASPHLFAGATSSGERVRSWLRTLSPGAVTARALKDSDALAGAVTMACI